MREDYEYHDYLWYKKWDDDTEYSMRGSTRIYTHDQKKKKKSKKQKEKESAKLNRSFKEKMNTLKSNFSNAEENTEVLKRLE